jgi:integrase/recombinase XerD
MKQKSSKSFQSLFDPTGERKYLTIDERQAFLLAAMEADRNTRTFCSMLMHTGCRISEALQLTADRVDFPSKAIIFKSLKKRREGIFRAVPVTDEFLDQLDLVHGLRSLQSSKSKGKNVRLWGWSRTTAWRRVKAIMAEAGIDTSGPSKPKGLRHGFGVAAVQSDVPLNMVQKWLGHADISTTTIYTNAVGEQERSLAERMWSKV